MVKRGVVKVELSIENHIIKYIKKGRSELKTALRRIKNNQHALSNIYTASHQIIKAEHELYKLQGIEGREIGKGKFVELKEISLILIF